MKLYRLFVEQLPVRSVATDSDLHLLNQTESRRVGSTRRVLMLTAAALSVLGFLGYYLPVYNYPELFPSEVVTLPFMGASFLLPWGKVLWCVLLTSIELFLLVLLNLVGVHEMGVATGFINAQHKSVQVESLLEIGLERKNRAVTRYGIDPFQGLNKSALFLFNVVLRLKGWLGTQVIRFLLRLLLGRYAVRVLLDFAGLPLYMAINAYSVHACLREARVIIMGQTVIGRLMQRMPRPELSPVEKHLLYDTLQYIAISKRDFHQNHYLLTKQLLEFFNVPSEKQHLLSDDYPERLACASEGIRSLCQLVMLLGFILDGHLSGREVLKLRQAHRDGLLRESYQDVRRYVRDFVNGSGVDMWTSIYLARIRETRQAEDSAVELRCVSQSSSDLR